MKSFENSRFFRLGVQGSPVFEPFDRFAVIQSYENATELISKVRWFCGFTIWSLDISPTIELQIIIGGIDEPRASWWVVSVNPSPVSKTEDLGHRDL